MTRMLSLSLCLLLPLSAAAQDAQVQPAPETVEVAPPAVDPPRQATLVPPDAAAPNQATESARRCGMSGSCAGHGGATKWVVLTGVVGAVVTAAAIGIAVGVSHANATAQVPK